MKSTVFSLLCILGFVVSSFSFAGEKNASATEDTVASRGVHVTKDCPKILIRKPNMFPKINGFDTPGTALKKVAGGDPSVEGTLRLLNAHLLKLNPGGYPWESSDFVGGLVADEFMMDLLGLDAYGVYGRAILELNPVGHRFEIPLLAITIKEFLDAHWDVHRTEN